MIDPHGGRTVASWRAARGALPVASSWPPTGDWAVVAAHPDDEVLGVGGALARWGARRTGRGRGRLHVVTATDGEAADPTAGPVARASLARRRRAEAVAADRALGIVPDRTFLGVPDGAVADHVDDLADRLEVLLAGIEVVATVAPDDGHPDHDAVGRATIRAARRRGIPVVRYAVWAFVADPDTHGRLAGASRLVLDDGEQRAKAAAVAAHASQVERRGPRAPVLPTRVLDHHLDGTEVVW